MGPEAKKPEEKKPEAKKPEAKKPEEKKPEAKKPDAKKPEAKKPEEKKPEQKKPDAKKPVPQEEEVVAEVQPEVQEGNEDFLKDLDKPTEVSVMEMHDHIVKLAFGSINPGSMAKLSVNYTNPNDSKVLKFSISPRGFKRKTDDEICDLISEQVVKQLTELGFDITLDDILNAKVQIKTTDVKKPEEKKPEAKKPEEKKPEAKKPEEKKPAAKKPEEKKPEAKKPEKKKPAEKKPEEKKKKK